MGMHHSGAQGANSSSGSKRNTFTRSLSNADVPPDEKDCKYKKCNKKIQKKNLCMLYIIYICNVSYTGNLHLLQSTNCCLSQLLCIVYDICISRSVSASSARLSTNVSYICFAGVTGVDAIIVLKCVYLIQQIIIVIKGCCYCIINTSEYIIHMEGT
jgi:hypothetical protein